jgi:hypothetical protein
MNDEQIVDALRAVQNQMSWVDREIFAREICQLRRTQFPNCFGGSQNDGLLSQLKARGCCDAPFQVDQAICSDVVDYFTQTPCYNHHVDLNHDGILRSVADTAKIAIYGSYGLEQNLTAPHILELALDPRLLDLAAGYLGCIPSIYSINTFWSFPASEVGNTQTFHYDEDDFKFITVFIYWTGMEKSEGEFYFVEKSHDLHEVEGRIASKRWARMISRALRSVRSAEEFRRVTRKRRNKTLRYLFPKEVVCITGPAGKAIVVDTFGIHRGSLPRTQARLCTWIRYGLYANWGYASLKTTPLPVSLVRGRVPTDNVTQFITRLLLDWRHV